MIEMPMELQASGLTIPQDHLDICRAQGVPTAGNAVGNTVNLLDLTGANEAPGPLPEGFTPRGIAALVMSIVCAFVGLGVITWSVHSFSSAPLDAAGSIPDGWKAFCFISSWRGRVIKSHGRVLPSCGLALAVAVAFDTAPLWLPARCGRTDETPLRSLSQ